MNDPTLFSAGALFTQDYLLDGIIGSGAYSAVDAEALRSRLQTIFHGFPHASKPNEATTESDLVWPILKALGWDEFLTQQNLSASGRVDVPDGLLFIDADAKAKANAHPEEWRRYQFGAAVLESKRWGRALDRAEGRTGADKDTPSTQLLRYLRRIDDLTSGELRWGLLTNGAKWRLYFAGARSTIDDYLELDLARIMGLDPDLLDSGISQANRDHWLRVFAAMFSRTAFERATAGAPSFHDTARKEAGYYEERVAKNLSDLVFKRAVWCCADAGHVVNPDGFAAQMEGGIIYGLTTALYSGITLKQGGVEQSNFHDYQMLRMPDAPDIATSVINADSKTLGGAGEPGLPPIAPAVTNAIFAATGQRIRSLPIMQHFT